MEKICIGFIEEGGERQWTCSFHPSQWSSIKNIIKENNSSKELQWKQRLVSLMFWGTEAVESRMYCTWVDVEGSSQTLPVEELFFIPPVLFPSGALLHLSPELQQQPLLQFPAGMGLSTEGAAAGQKHPSVPALPWMRVQALVLWDLQSMALALPMKCRDALCSQKVWLEFSSEKKYTAWQKLLGKLPLGCVLQAWLWKAVKLPFQYQQIRPWGSYDKPQSTELALLKIVYKWTRNKLIWSDSTASINLRKENSLNGMHYPRWKPGT